MKPFQIQPFIVQEAQQKVLLSVLKKQAALHYDRGRGIPCPLSISETRPWGGLTLPGRWEKHSKGRTVFSSVSSSRQCLSQDSREVKRSVVNVLQDKRAGNCLRCSAIIPVLHYIYPLHSTKSLQSLNMKTPSKMIPHTLTVEGLWLWKVKRRPLYSIYLTLFVVNISNSRESTALLSSCNHMDAKKTEETREKWPLTWLTLGTLWLQS